MTKIRSIFVSSLIGILILTACAQQKADQTMISPVETAQVSAATSEPIIVSSGPVTISTAEISPSIQDSPTPPATLTAADGLNITLDDRGKTISMKVGESFLLKLGEIYNWSVQISDQSVLSRVMNIAVVSGAQGVYQARKAGTVTLSATGDPFCRQTKPACAMPSLLFTITVIVN